MLDERTIKKIHELLNEKNEHLVCSIYCETSFHGGFYVELRNSLTNNAGLLYQFNEESKKPENNFRKNSIDYWFTLIKYHHIFSGFDEAMEYFNYRPYIKMTQLESDDYLKIMSLLKNNPLPDIKGDLMGLDGHYIVFQSYVDCMSKYSYWVYPPNGYDYLRIITNIICKYLNVPYANLAYVDQTIL